MGSVSGGMGVGGSADSDGEGTADGALPGPFVAVGTGDSDPDAALHAARSMARSAIDRERDGRISVSS